MPGLATSLFRLNECQSFSLACWDKDGRTVAGGAYDTLASFMAGMKFCCRQPGVIDWVASVVTKDGWRLDATLEARKEFEYRLDDEEAFSRDVLGLVARDEPASNAAEAKPDRESPQLFDVRQFIQEVLFGQAAVSR